MIMEIRGVITKKYIAVNASSDWFLAVTYIRAII